MLVLSPFPGRGLRLGIRSERVTPERRSSTGASVAVPDRVEPGRGSSESRINAVFRSLAIVLHIDIARGPRG